MTSPHALPAPTLGFLLNDVARLLRKRFEQNARGLGLTRAQWQTLAHLRRAEGIQQSGLADILEIEPITLARIVDRLEAAGLVERRPDPKDRRVKRLFLRPEAHPLIHDMQAIGDATRAEALAGVSDADRDHLERILATMKTNLVQACGTGCRQKEAAHG
ncbi:MarR family transcriptional regulator [Rhodoplanes sp. TEM]|uniref:MarR family transcriptional regulator n=1 Tax=Rhodoplanes tepidamans TaxID=200616 RepID=A0ABT5J487_RHOTP|nr:MULTISPECIES: MarR family transcriptional regulator [Rhodoplanes]MDC7784454.1 MarR family transcriptional regulator [Rhodoplanes tepidamans]MDC7983484.1 MarR family transcriptional regulator [Rhodoplanes sp. TEM]MDQ0356961.1 DNA-binding MarR family transcriptional regulator [Rhodoplanes tepidamans]